MMPIEMATQTTTALLDGLFDLQNDLAWRQLDDRFRPVIVAFAQRLGLGPADAADVAQETLTQFVRDYREGKYDRSRGRLRSWIIGIARHRIAELNRKRAGRREFRGNSAIMTLPDDGELANLWDAECRQAALGFAMRQLASAGKVSRRTIDAFRMHVIEGASPEEVAEALTMSVRAVYIAKHRCLARLREAMDQLGDVYDFA
jgi:RNA polymerase sigma factor (sigma-70 family)